MKKLMFLGVAVLFTAGLVFTTGAHGADGAGGSWTGEVVDLACYVSHGDGGRGADHAGCAKSCVKNGQPMGLLTDDGTLVLLAADHKDGSAFEALKDLAGEKAKVSGVLAEKDGMKIVTVKGSEKAG